MDGSVTANEADSTWVELRVHGVSGTPPESLLDTPHVRQVDGDDRSRFFRAVRGQSGQWDPADELRASPDGHVLEGFHWGRYTSGSLIQSLWILLLPIGLVNVAAFMLPGRPTDSSRATKAARTATLAVLRMLGGTVTLVFSLGVTMILSEVVAVRWLPRHGVDWHGVLPAALVLSGVLLALFGGTSWFVRRLGRPVPQADPDRGLPVTPPHGGPAHSKLGGAAAFAERSPFGDPEFYRGEPDTLTLRGLHVALCLALPAHVAAIMANSGTAAGLTKALIGLTLVVMFLLGDNNATGVSGVRPGRWVSVWLWPWVTRLLVTLSILALGVTAFRLSDSQQEPHNRGEFELGPLRAQDGVFDNICFALVLLVLFIVAALAVTTAWLAWVTREAYAGTDPSGRFKPYSKGMAALAVASLGVLLTVGFTAAAVNGATTLLTGKPAGTPSSIDSDFLQLVSYAWGVAWVPMLVVVAWVALLRLRHRARLGDLAERSFPKDMSAGIADPGGYGLPADRVRVWLSRTANAVWIARLKNAIPALVWTMVLGGGLLALGVLWVWIDIHRSVSMQYGALTDLPWWRFIAQLGQWTLLGLITLLVFLVRSGVGDGNVRRSVNVVWDVVAFWPHAVHPFIPEPYSLRTVGDLAARIRGHASEVATADGGRPVVVCAHSQGSLISFAALQLLADDLGRVGLVTFGSQLRVIFPRAFPMYVNYDAVKQLYRGLNGHWVNLYRDTDPLAGPVLSWDHHVSMDPEHAGWLTLGEPGSGPGSSSAGGVAMRFGSDWRLLDPAPRSDRRQLAPIDALRKHSLYWTSPAWRDALITVRDEGANGASTTQPLTKPSG